MNSSMSALAFELPRELEATEPPEARGIPRDGVALLVTDISKDSHECTTFSQLDRFLHPCDLLVVNDSATIAAAIEATRSDGSQFDIHFSTRISERLWLVEPRDRPGIRSGERVALEDGGTLTFLDPRDGVHSRLWYARVHPRSGTAAFLSAYGRPIAYGYMRSRFPLSAYQTIFARVPGSVEMPSAGRPFTLRLLDRLAQRGIGTTAVTLHCGVASPERHEPPVDEWYRVGSRTVEQIERTRLRRGRIIAIGTTVVRALESSFDESGCLIPSSGWTSHIVDRDHPPRVAGGLLTGLHEPRASHLNMLEAFASPAILREAYEVALRQRYLWHEFGDVHLLLR